MKGLSAVSFACTNITSPGSPDVLCTRKLLSRSIDPKRACLIFNNLFASSVQEAPGLRIVGDELSQLAACERFLQALATVYMGALEMRSNEASSNGWGN